METVEVEPVDLDEDVNIYGDICDFDLGEEIEKVSKHPDRLYPNLT